MNKNLKIAIIGTGASAFGAMTALEAHANADIHVFDNWSGLIDKARRSNVDKRIIDATYAKIKATSGAVSIPIPKSASGTFPNISSSGFQTYKGVGGLTNFWGTTMLAFSNDELAKLSIDPAEIKPSYEAISSACEISGRPDDFEKTFAPLLPPVETVEITKAVSQRLASTAPSDFGFQFGVNRVAHETRKNMPACCVYCGECFVGCQLGSAFCTADYFLAARHAGKITPVDALVERLDIDAGDVFLADGKYPHTFDLIFVCAGALGSSKLMRGSLSVEKKFRIADSSSLNIPIFSLRHIFQRDKEIFALAHYLFEYVDRDDKTIVLQGQLYPSTLHFARSLLPKPLLFFAPVLMLFLSAIVWLRVYLPHDAAIYHEFDAQDGADDSGAVAIVNSAREKYWKKLVREKILRPLNRFPFLFAPLILRGKTSAHYAGGFVGEKQGFDEKEKRYGRTTYVCDSSTWSYIPTTSPTYTIMAQAHLIATRAIKTSRPGSVKSG